LVNHTAARAANGRFLLRFDGGNNSAYCQAIRDGMKRDLEYFGLDWDGEWSYADHQAELTEQFREWVKNEPSAYACFCTPDDIGRRGLPQSRVERPEKYPPPGYAISEVYLKDGDKIVRPNSATASSEARGAFIGCNNPVSWYAASLVLAHDDYCWRPWSCGFQGPWDPPVLTLRWNPAEEYADYLFIVFPTGAPARIRFEYGHDGIAEDWGWVEPANTKAYATPDDWSGTVISLGIPIKHRYVDYATIHLLEPLPWIQRPYHYDGYCASIKAWDRRPHFEPHLLDAAMDDPEKGVIRLHRPPYHPTAVWFDGAPDLAWYSPWVDKQLGVTHVYRGQDLRAFYQLEETVCACLNYWPERAYHGLIVDRWNTKLSKFTNAEPAMATCMRLYGGDPKRMLSEMQQECFPLAAGEQKVNANFQLSRKSLFGFVHPSNLIF
jgi:hypothetical protein